MKTVLIVIAILAAIIVGGLWRMGIFQKIDFTAQEIGPLNTVYLEHKGPFSKIPEKISEVKKYLDENKIDYTEAFGEYMDDPRTVKAEELRSNAGYIVEKIMKVKPPFIAKKFPKKFYITATFVGSPMLGAMVVYPKAMKWLTANGYTMSGPVIELYKMDKKKMPIEYLFEVTKKEEQSK